MKPETAVHPLRMRRFEGNAKDPYRTHLKPRDAALCPECGAVFEKGHWLWSKRPPADAVKVRCEACRRVRDRYPAGIVVLKGAFVKEHRREVVDIARAEQKRENADHPLNRIMKIADAPEGLSITTTDVHLPRAIGAALKRAHKGELRVHYDVHGYAVRVEWRR